MIALDIDGVKCPITWQQDTDDRETLVVRRQKRWIGFLSWHSFTGEIKLVKVEEKYRRRGIATALLQIARERYDPKIKHSPIRSFDGNAWVESLGEHLPKG